MKMIRILLLSLLLLPLAAFAGRQGKMDSPPTIDVPSHVSQAKVESAIKKALKGHGYSIGSADGGKIIGRYSRSNFWVKVAVVYNSKTITIQYVDSKNLDYEKKDGVRYIHPNYNRWVRILEKSISHDID